MQRLSLADFEDGSQLASNWAILQRPEAAAAPDALEPVWRLLWEAGRHDAIAPETAAKLLRGAAALRRAWLQELVLMLQAQLDSLQAAGSQGSAEPSPSVQDSPEQQLRCWHCLLDRAEHLQGSQLSGSALQANQAELEGLLTHTGRMADRQRAQKLAVWRAALLAEGSDSSWPSDEQLTELLTSAKKQLASQAAPLADSSMQALRHVNMALAAVSLVMSIIPAASRLLPRTLLKLEADFVSILNHPDMLQDFAVTWENENMRDRLRLTEAGHMIGLYDDARKASSGGALSLALVLVKLLHRSHCIPASGTQLCCTNSFSPRPSPHATWHADAVLHAARLFNGRRASPRAYIYAAHFPDRQRPGSCVLFP